MKIELLESEDKLLREQLTQLDQKIGKTINELEIIQERLNNLYRERERIVGGLGTIETLKTKLKESDDGK